MEGQGFPRGRCDLHPGFRDHPQALSSAPHRNASVMVFMTFLNQTVRGSPPWRAPVSLFLFLFPWHYRRALQPRPPPLLLKALGLGSHSSLSLPRLLCLTLLPLPATSHSWQRVSCTAGSGVQVPHYLCPISLWRNLS